MVNNNNNSYFVNNNGFYNGCNNNNADISAASDATTVESPATSDAASSVGIGEGEDLEEALVAPWMDELFEFSDSHFDDAFAIPI